ncbi:MAG: NAD(P)-dependent oxidoreductase [Anaerorhabdus sp.]|uniref:NAD-dependent epimerase/dehydratase family protein n=1 Tax=Anaerorhabdus sp. TaxID=1872524 RepID=UPI002FCB90B1
MKILVTGANGYIGSHVVKNLISQKHDVFVIDKSFANIERYNVNVVDINIFEENENIYNLTGNPDVLLHMAWRDGFNHMAPTHLKDLPLHVSFIENMIKGGLKHVVIMGSMHEVGYWEGTVTEDTPCNPKSYYGIAKNALRQAIDIISNQKDVVFQWLRAYYITGDDMKSNSVFAKILLAAKEGKKEFPLNSGKNLYDFIDVDELATQISAVSTQTNVTGIINCCTGKPVSLLERITKFIEENNLDLELKIGAFPDRSYDSPGIWGDNTKICKILKEK